MPTSTQKSFYWDRNYSSPHQTVANESFACQLAVQALTW